MRLWFCIASCFVLCSHEYGGGVLGTFVVLHLGSCVRDSLGVFLVVVFRAFVVLHLGSCVRGSLGVFWWWFFARLWFCILSCFHVSFSVSLHLVPVISVHPRH